MFAIKILMQVVFLIIGTAYVFAQYISLVFEEFGQNENSPEKVIFKPEKVINNPNAVKHHNLSIGNVVRTGFFPDPLKDYVFPGKISILTPGIKKSAIYRTKGNLKNTFNELVSPRLVPG